MGRVVVKSSTARIVENKNGTRSTYTSYRTNSGKTKSGHVTRWHKSGGPTTPRARKKK